MKKRSNVALLVETSVVYGREILDGISTYAKAHGNWSIYLDEREVLSRPPEWLFNWGGDGVISRWTTPKLVEVFQELKLPVVDLNDRYGYLGIPRIGSDMRAIGAMAAEHLLERGFSNIAFCGFAGRVWSAERLAGVVDAVRGRGRFCGALESAIEDLQKFEWQEERGRIAAWLKDLPRPLGVVAGNDVRAYHVLDACRAAGLIVPEEVAVVGVDNSRTFCELSTPSLSTVVPNARRIGMEAAQLLDQLMAGRAPEEKERLIPPAEVITRQSSDVLAVGDPLIARAIEHIRQYAADGLGVGELVSKLGSTRSIIERGFRKYLGRSPQEEIRRVRLNRVKELLLQTDWTLEHIAEKSGFEHPEYMTVQFKRIFGETPSKWRSEHQPEPRKRLPR